MKIESDNPKLTAYVLNEVDETERAAIEAQLKTDPACRQAVAEIRALTKTLTHELRTEPVPVLSEEIRKAIESHLEPPARKVLLFHRPFQPHTVGLLAAAACLTVMLGWIFWLSHLQTHPVPAPSESPTGPAAAISNASTVVISGGYVINVTPGTKATPPAASLAPNSIDGSGSVVQSGATLGLQNSVNHTTSESLTITGSGVGGQGVINNFSGGNTSQGKIVGHETPDSRSADGSFTIGGATKSGGLEGGQIKRNTWTYSTAGNHAPGTDAGGGAESEKELEKKGRNSQPLSGSDGNTLSRSVATSGPMGSEVAFLQPNLKESKSSRIVVQLKENERFKVPLEASRPNSKEESTDEERLQKSEENLHRAEGDFNTEAYDRIVDNPFLSVGQEPLSTFSIDVDTASYSNIRRFLTDGGLPPKDAVRIEEMVNYFNYDDPQPKGEVPFSVNVEIAGAPWQNEHRLVRIGLKGRDIAVEKRPLSNLVFLIDVSGSMQPSNKLPLIKQALPLMVKRLGENDRVGIVVYAGNAGLVLPSTACDHKEEILRAIENLEAGGSTNGGQGIELAYQLATKHFIKGGVNRVILATDGDFNVGITDQGALTRLIEEKAKSGIFLSVLGFGMGNLKDSTMEKLADKGNGNYAYIDTLNEARKVLVDQLSGTLVTIAKDVKIQVEFNPARVAAYRLIGYENRMLRKEDFNDDKKDAGEIGAGHTVTALYEIMPVGKKLDPPPAVDPLKYQPPPKPAPTLDTDEMLTVKLRYKEPAGSKSKLLEIPARDTGLRYAKASTDFRFSAAVASFGMILRDSPHKGSATLGAVLELAEESKGTDSNGYRAEFIELVKKARSLGRQ